MAKRQRSGVLNRLAGKKFVFSGKFDYGVEDTLKALADAQQGTVKDDLDDKVDYLVVPDLSAGKTIQKRALSLNGKGAAIQVIDADDFKKMSEPTEDEILALLRAGESETYTTIRGPAHYYQYLATPPRFNFHSENLNGISLKSAGLEDLHFDACSFVGANLERARFATATDCDFSKVSGEFSQFIDVKRCRFRNAKLKGARFAGDFSETDFTGAALEETSFSDEVIFYQWKSKKVSPTDAIFNKAILKSATFQSLHLKSPDYSGADLTGASFQECVFDSATFSKAILRDTVFCGCKLKGADLSNAELTGANLADADLTGANLAGANLKNANLRGTKLDGVDLAKAKNYDPNTSTSGSLGPALTELDAVNKKARRIQVTFSVRSSDGNVEEHVGIDSNGLKYGWGVRMPQNIASRRMMRRGGPATFSGGLLQIANAAGHLQVHFETVDVSSTKSPKGGKELRDLVLRGIAEAFAQEMPPEAELAAATKKHRDAARQKGAAARQQREQAKAEAEKQKQKAKKQIAKKIEKAVGKVSDVASFLKALELRIEKPKIDKATKMLKASGFKLFNDVTDQHVSGVVKSQTDPDLVYACRVAHDGQYSCCTQNLNVCGGLRGSICKHLLVLIIGLVQAGELDPTTIDAWIAKTHSVKPELDKETMGAIFIKYKGAEAGEVDWRPTETVPEDYYAL